MNHSAVFFKHNYDCLLPYPQLSNKAWWSDYWLLHFQSSRSALCLQLTNLSQTFGVLRFEVNAAASCKQKVCLEQDFSTFSAFISNLHCYNKLWLYTAVVISQPIKLCNSDMPSHILEEKDTGMSV